MDDENVNLTFYQEFKGMSDQSLFHELIEIGIFNLHFVHGALESSFGNNEWKVKELLKVG